MKKIMCALLALFLCAGLMGCGTGTSGGGGLWIWLLVMLDIGVLALAVLRTISFVQYSRRRRRNRRWKKPARLDSLTICLYGAAAVLLLLTLLCGILSGGQGDRPDDSTGSTGSTDGTSESTDGTAEPTETEPEEETLPFAAAKTEDSDPMNWGINWEILVDGQEVDSYTREEKIWFGDPEDYFVLPGIATFRGNNYRNSTSYGTASVVDEELSTEWTYATGSLAGSTWTGSGWTGQPLIVQWDAQTRQNMNLYESAKAKEDLVEVIYATLDGHIYFLDLETGAATRDAIDLGMCFKGAGALDPRGYPIMYVGAGDENSSGKQPRMFIISLIDGTVLYEHGNGDFLAVRKDNDYWCAFDASPLVDAETDTLIWVGENGILYTMKLNAAYDAEAGTVSVAPADMVVTRYQTDRSGKSEYWYGYEASADIVGGYLYVSENGGMFYCVDLNTMELIWAQDTRDDSNASPVFEMTDDGKAYIYTAPSLHWTQDSDAKGTISLYKLDAATGEIVWEQPYDVHTVSGVSGGVQSTPLLGRTGTALEGLVIYSISRTPNTWSGLLVALDTATGEEVWRYSLDSYAWSSPVAVYTDDGTGYVVICDSGGYAHFISAEGKCLDKLNLGGLVEATPAIYEDMLVVGTRAKQICGIKVS